MARHTIGTLAKALVLGFALIGVFGAGGGLVEAREFKLVKIKAITPADFAEGCAMEGGIHNQDFDNDGNLVESSCTEPDGSGVDCDWGTRECRVYPPKRQSTQVLAPRAEVTNASEGPATTPTTGISRTAVVNVQVIATPEASR